MVGGFGSAVAEFMLQHGYKNDLRILGIPDRIVEHGSLRELHQECGFDAQSIKATILEMMKGKISINVLM